MSEEVEAYYESRKRIVLSAQNMSDGRDVGLNENKTGDIVQLNLIIDKNVQSHNKRRLFFKDELYPETTFMAFNDSQESISRFLEHYGVQKGGKVVGEFEVFRNGISVDLLVPKNQFENRQD